MDLSAECWNKAEFEASAGLDPRPGYALALKAADEWIGAAPTSEAHERRAAIYEYLAAWEKANGIDPLPSLRRALAAANEAVKAEGNRAMAFARRGRIRQSFGEEKTGQDALKQYRAGIADLTRAIELEKSPGVEFFAVRGLLYILAGSLMPAGEQEAEYRKAVADYGKAIELAPNDGQQRRSRSRAHLWVMQAVSDRPDEALGCAKLSVDDARRAAEIEPSAESYQYLGEALCLLAERGEASAWPDALKAYEQAANLAPLNESYQAKIEELKAKVAPK
jgi:tetratricopeptide (TPR) repeat protein